MRPIKCLPVQDFLINENDEYFLLDFRDKSGAIFIFPRLFKHTK